MLRKPQPQDQARIIEQAFSLQGIKLPHRQALDLIARLHGHKDWHLMSQASADSEQLQPSVAPVAPKASAEWWAETADPRRQIALLWSIEDVHSVRPDLDDAQALAVLQTVHKRHDSSYGVTWDSVESAADDLYRRWLQEATFYPEDGGTARPATVKLKTGDVYLDITPQALSLDYSLSPGSLQGELEFTALPGQRFAVDNELFGADSDALHDFCQQLRSAGVTPAL